MTTRFSFAIFLATIACAAVPATPPASPLPSSSTAEWKTSNLEMIAHHCDKYGGIDSIAFATDGPGPHLLRWDNERICGLRS